MIKPFSNPIYVTRPLLPDIKDFNNNLQQIWDSKWLTNNGPKHTELEERLKKYLNLQNLVLFNNGTLALTLGIKALELEGEVITTPFTFPATVQSLDWNGLTPVFCDIESNTCNIDANKIEELITERTSGILAVHVFGNPCDVEKIQIIAEKYELKVIYDGAHTFGTELGEIPIGSFGDMTMFSFHATKLFNTIEGGALVFKDNSLISTLNLLKNFGIVNTEEVVLSGTNAKMNELQASMGLEVLKLVDEEMARREKVRKAYKFFLDNIPGIKIIEQEFKGRKSQQYFAISVNEDIFGKSRNWVFEVLMSYNVHGRKYFYPLCSNFSWYSNNKSANTKNLPIANKVVDEVLCLPFYGDLKLDDIEKIATIIKSSR